MFIIYRKRISYIKIHNLSCVLGVSGYGWMYPEFFSQNPPQPEKNFASKFPYDWLSCFGENDAKQTVKPTLLWRTDGCSFPFLRHENINPDFRLDGKHQKVNEIRPVIDYQSQKCLLEASKFSSLLTVL